MHTIVQIVTVITACAGIALLLWGGIRTKTNSRGTAVDYMLAAAGPSVVVLSTGVLLRYGPAMDAIQTITWVTLILGSVWGAVKLVGMIRAYGAAAAQIALDDLRGM
ncbi:hypothetical protein ACT3SZ_14980 [Corynebacterium sp. AOP40-9SA-29]|uniref:hypothetical protein n=1 Tax=Corynebacterium sp. AOP40-9SA-29 TaxID=3457677 RepID=UPI004033E530